MIRLIGLIFICWLAVATAQSNPTNKTTFKGSECIDGPSVWYSGKRNTTGLGYTCQRWDVTKPHKPRYTPADGGRHNYCRNPDHDIHGVWCYTTNSSKKWDYCNITKCPDDSDVIWTSMNTVNKTTQLYSLKADHEYVRQISSGSNINVSVIASSNPAQIAEFWAVASDYRSSKVFFADYRSQYVGVINRKTNETNFYLEGMGHGIESMAFDWKTNNLYMSDSTLKWILVTNVNFEYYAPVYVTDPDPAYGLAVHSMKRFLFFSTYKSLSSKIVRTDLAGKNATTLFKFPDVYDVTGITVDYTEDRLYWTDFTGYGSVLQSSNLDGTNLTRQYYSGTSIYWGIATYRNMIYVTDVHRRFKLGDGAFYYLWFIPKQKNERGQYNIGNYRVTGKPRGVTVMSRFVEYSTDQDVALGACPGTAPPCDHICLPRINATRECICSLGYTKQGDAKCVTKVITGDYMIVADAGQGKIFKVPIQQTTNVTSTDYSVQQLPFNTKVSYLTNNVIGGFVFWSDKSKMRINKMVTDGSVGRLFINNTFARFLAYEPINQNLYYVDDDKQYIMVADYLNAYVKTIMTPNVTRANKTDIKQLAFDMQERYVYWTDTRKSTDDGEIWRMKYDGTGKELVFNNINRPYGITINQRNRTLYFTDAKLAHIYAVPLNLIVSGNTTIPAAAIKFDFSGRARKTPLLVDVQVSSDMVYFNDRGNNYMEVFDPRTGVSSVKSFGPKQFYRIRSMILFDRDYYTNFLKTIANPCATLNCNHICVSITSTKATCLCRNGFRKVSNNMCVNDGTQNPNQPPSHRGTCPTSQTRNLEPCGNYTKFIWATPAWSDDSTPPSQLIQTAPSKGSPAIVGPGIYQYSYSATDLQGAVGLCQFTFTVTRTTCRSRQTLGAEFMETSTWCGDDGPQYNIICVDRSQDLMFGDQQHSNMTNRCFRSGEWMYPNLNGLKCKPKTTTAAPTTTTRAVTTTRSSTQAATTTTLNPPTTTLAQTTTTKPATKPATKTATKTVPSAGATTKTPQASATAKTTKGMASSSSTGASTKTPKNPVTAKQTGHSLSSGATAGIVILAIVLIIIIALVIVAYIRRGKVGGMTIPVFWKPREDTIKLQNDTDDAINHYSVL